MLGGVPIARREVDDFCHPSAIVFHDSGPCELDRPNEGRELHDALDVNAANVLMDMNEAVADLEVRRCFHEENGVETNLHKATTPHSGTTERGDVFLMQVNNFARALP